VNEILRTILGGVGRGLAAQRSIPGPVGVASRMGGAILAGIMDRLEKGETPEQVLARIDADPVPNIFLSAQQSDARIEELLRQKFEHGGD
jgi:hypothetical protein